jgi:hypothetical protein
MSQTKAQLIDGKSAEIEFTGGSASGPAISFTGDTNTGIYSPGADQVAVATNGTGRVFVDASGNVGVGTSSPNSDLHILSGNPRVNLQSSGASSTADYFLLCRKADNTAYSVNVKATGESLTFGTGGNPGNSYVPSERLRITSAGLVGIGTDSPGELLHVVNPTTTAEIRLSGGTTAANYSQIGFHGGSTRNAEIAVNSAFMTLTHQNSGVVRVETGGSERARIDSSGRLLVGTSTDTTAKLVVKGSAGSGDDGINVISGSTTAGSKAAIFFSPSSTGSSSTGSAIKTERLSPDGSDLQFYTCTALGSSPTERMRITSAGLVGINTTSPSGQLSVTFNGNSVQGIVATDTGTPGAGNYYLLCGSSGGIQNVASNEIHHSAVSALAFRTGSGNGTERARIDSSGRLLVGTSSASLTNKFLLQGDTSSASNGGYMRLQTTNSIIAGTSLGSIGFGDSANNGALIEAKGDVSWSPFTKGSRLEFSTTADGASSPTERMRITSLGVPRFFSSDTGIISKVAAVAGTAETLFRGSHTATNVLNGTDCIFIRANGNVENTNNSYGAISDIKLKENIVDASPQWDDLKALQVRNYNFKEGQTHTQIGLVAQEVELVSPGLVSESPDRDEEGNDLGTVTKSVNYSVLYMKAVKALQEAMERIETLEQRLNDAGIN